MALGGCDGGRASRSNGTPDNEGRPIMIVTGRRHQVIALVLWALAAVMAGTGCRKATPPKPKPAPPAPATRRAKRLVPRRAPTTQPTTTVAAAPKPKPKPKPTPWKSVRKITLDESFAFFKKLQQGSALRVPKLDEAPTIDGKLDEAYKKATPLTFRFLDARPAKPTAPTTAYVVSTDTELFVFFQCDSPDMSALRATVKQHDGDVWNDDSVELFLDPHNKRRMGTYMHIIINPLGTTAEIRSPKSNADESWNPALRVKTMVGKTGWTVEVALPFADFIGKAQSVERVWAANFNRMARLPGENEDTAWCPTGGEDSHKPGYFGLLWLDAGKVYADYVRWTGPRHIHAPTAKPAFRFTPVPPEAMAKCKDLTPNVDKTYWFGTGTLEGNREVLVVLTDVRAVQVSSLHGWRPITARWLNAKLLYISRQVHNTDGYYCIYDVEHGKVVLEESFDDGTGAWGRISERLEGGS